jgi:micrococcal nuclease
MRRNSKLTSTAIILTFLFSAAGLAQDFTGRVVGISDGDTITVRHDGRGEKIRLNGIDCPERGQAFGHRAKQFTSGLAFGKEVNVQIKGQDRYGRTIADVILPDGRILNREIVRAGFAWWFRRYAPKDTELERLESEAREAKRGLWIDPNLIPPWEWRKQRHHSHLGGLEFYFACLAIT